MANVDTEKITWLDPDEDQAKHGATLSELLDAQSGGRGIFLAGRAAAYLSWRTPFKVNPNGTCWRFWMDLVVEQIVKDVEGGNLGQLKAPIQG